MVDGFWQILWNTKKFENLPGLTSANLLMTRGQCRYSHVDDRSSFLYSVDLVELFFNRFNLSPNEIAKWTSLRIRPALDWFLRQARGFPRAVLLAGEAPRVLFGWGFGPTNSPSWGWGSQGKCNNRWTVSRWGQSITSGSNLASVHVYPEDGHIPNLFKSHSLLIL